MSCEKKKIVKGKSYTRRKNNKQHQRICSAFVREHQSSTMCNGNAKRAVYVLSFFLHYNLSLTLRTAICI